jgi:tetratricopeptide (TPR) repeat protein
MRASAYFAAICFAGVMLGFFAGCASPTMDVTSSPAGAKIEAVRDSEAPRAIGNTPLTLTKDSHPEAFQPGTELRISKEGYDPEAVLIPASSLPTQTRLNVTLTEHKLPGSCVNATETIEEVAKGVANVGRMITKKNYVESERLLQDLLSKHPDVATLYVLRGNVAYLEKDISGALENYKKAHDLSPDDAEINRMVTKLKTVRGEKEGQQ